MQKVRWGLLSTANINRKLIPALQASERADLVAVASRTQASADVYARKWDIAHAFGSYEAMLASDVIDVIYNPLPNHLHAEWSIKAMRAGKHVLCEKPFALALDEVDGMAAVAEETGLVLAEAFMYRHHPQTKAVGEWVHSGRLGEVRLVQGYFSFTLNNPENVRLVPEWGGGCLWDVGCYPLSFAQFIMGAPPEWVRGTQRLGETGVDIFFAGQLHYKNGAVAQIGSAFETPFHTHVTIIGTEGRLEIPRPFVGEVGERVVTFHPAQGDPQALDFRDEYLYLGEVEDMQDAILEGRPNYLTLAESRDHVRTLLALYESARSDQGVTLESE